MPLVGVEMPVNATIPLAAFQFPQPMLQGRIPFSSVWATTTGPRPAQVPFASFHPAQVLSSSFLGPLPMAPSSNAQHAQMPPLSTPAPTPTIAHNSTNSSTRGRKDRGPNWTQQEVMALVLAKWDIFIKGLGAVDGHDLMVLDSTKWMRILDKVMRANISPCLRDGPACKAKWNSIMPDFKKILDYFSRTGTNILEYWDLSSAQSKEFGLSKQFSPEIFHGIQEWYGACPQSQPPSMVDTFSPSKDAKDVADNDTSHHKSQDPIDIAGVEGEECIRDGSPLQSPQPGTSTPRSYSSTPALAGHPSLFIGTQRMRPASGIPPGITPQVISSSRGSSYSVGRRPGSTGVKRKHVSGHTLMSEATKASGQTMARQMQENAEAIREMERIKIDVQFKLFEEHMKFLRDKDQQHYENATEVNAIAKMAVEKQGKIVGCLSDLTNVMSMGLSRDGISNYQRSPL